MSASSAAKYINIEEVLNWVREDASPEDLKKIEEEIYKRMERDIVPEKELTPIKIFIQKINNPKDLRRVEIILKEQKEKLIEPGQKSEGGSKSLTIKTIKGTDYIYEQWKGEREEGRKKRKDCKNDKNSTVKTHRLGPVSKGFPPNYDLSVVKISESVRKHFPQIFG